MVISYLISAIARNHTFSNHITDNDVDRHNIFGQNLVIFTIFIHLKINSSYCMKQTSFIHYSLKKVSFTMSNGAGKVPRETLIWSFQQKSAGLIFLVGSTGLTNQPN